MVGVAKQIIGSFEDLGKQVGSEVVKAPAEIAGKALESLGTTKSTKQQSAVIGTDEAGKGKPEVSGPLSEFNRAKDEKTKQAIARAALEQFAGKPKSPEPSVREKSQMAEEQKKEQAAKQVTQAAAVAPVFTPSKPKRGNLYGIAQKASSEKSRNAR